MMTVAEYAPPMNEDTDRLTRADAAGHLGVSVQTVDRYAAAGRLTRHRNPVTLRVWFERMQVEALRCERDGEGATTK